MYYRRVVAPFVALALATVTLTLEAGNTPSRARKAMVVSQSDLASEVGWKVMRDGGNAIDGAVATAFALAVTHPTAGNIGGGGFIESSIPVYWEDTLVPGQLTFKSPAEIAAVWRAKGVQQNDNVLVYCQVGMRASHDLFTLALLGHDLTKLRNYYGAWEEWGNRDDTPIKNRE